jgi:threonine dehydrogenase-like Zn-dependent dehydrogenase
MRGAGEPCSAASDVALAQQHRQRYVPRLLDYISRGELDPTMLLTHDMSLEESPMGYELFKEKKDNCVRAVFRP